MGESSREPADREPEAEASPSTRAKILETAESLFARFGFAGVGMRAVADSVGVSKSALFHHFPTKRALWAAVLERSMLEFDRRLSAADSAGGALERMRLWVEAVIDSLVENPSRAPLLLRSLFEVEDEEPVDAPAREVLSRVLGRVAAGLEAGIAAGEIRPVSVPHTLQSLIGLTVFHFASGDFGEDLLGAPVFSAAEIRRRKDHVIGFMERALRAHPE
jgi:AcrR family transcriptional regulator